MTTSKPPEKRRSTMQHVTESHQIFDRVTLLEANVSSLADSVNKLAGSVQSTEATVGEIKAMIGAVGKTDGKTILTLGASVVGALAIIGSVFLGPIQRDVAYLERHRMDDEKRLETVVDRQRDNVKKLAEMGGEQKLMDWRIKALEDAR